MAVYDNSFGIDLSHEIVIYKTLHNSKTSSPGIKKSLPNFQTYKISERL